MTGLDIEPDNADLYQVEPEAMHLTPIPVVVEGPVRVQDPPALSIVVAQVFADSSGTAVQGYRVLGEDPRRKIARIVSKDTVMRVGTSQKQVMSQDTCALWPIGVPLEITGRSEIWVAADSATSRISVVSELWSV